MECNLRPHSMWVKKNSNEVISTNWFDLQRMDVSDIASFSQVERCLDSSSKVWNQDLRGASFNKGF